MKLFKNISPDRENEIFGVLLWAVALFLFLSLVTYSHSRDADFLNSKDFSLNKLFTHPLKNQAGVMGALVSYALYYLLGLSSFFLPVVLAFWGTNFLFKTEFSTLFKKTVYIFAFIFLLGIFFSISWVNASAGQYFSRVTIGGWFSLLSAKILVKIFGTFGSYTLSLAFLLVVALLATPWKFSESLLFGKSVFRRFYDRGSKWWELKRMEKRRTQRVEEIRDTLKEEKEHESLVEESTQIRGDKTERIHSADEKEEPINLVSELKNSLRVVRGKEENKIGAYQYPGLSILNEPPQIKPSVTNEELKKRLKY